MNMEVRSAARLFVGKLRSTGFFNIVGSTLLNKVIVFLSGMILVRVLSQAEYGAYSYALNIINYFILLNGLGTSSCVVQYCVEKGEGEAAEQVYRVLCALGLVWDVVLTALIAVFALFVELPIAGSSRLLLLLAPFPLFSLAVEFQQQRLRSQFRNKEYALSTNLNTLSVLVGSIGGAVVASSPGLSLGRSFAMAVSGVAVRVRYGVRLYLNPGKVSRALLLDIVKMALTVCMTNAVSQALILVGTTLVGSLGGDAVETAIYSTATTVPFALSFIPSMLMIYVTPYFVKHAADRRWVIRGWLSCAGGLAIVCVLVTVVLCMSADWLIPLLFGARYSGSVASFRILMVAFVIGSPLRTVAGNILATHRRYVYNFISGCISLAVCVAGTMFFVPQIGAEGAAAGYLAAMVLGSIINSIGLLVYAGKPHSVIV